MSYLEHEHLVPGQRYRISFDHDLGAVAFEATLVAIYEQGEVDPFIVLDEATALRDPEANEIGWQSPRTYWDNGLVMDGGLEWVEWVGPAPTAEITWPGHLVLCPRCSSAHVRTVGSTSTGGVMRICDSCGMQGDTG